MIELGRTKKEKRKENAFCFLSLRFSCRSPETKQKFTSRFCVLVSRARGYIISSLAWKDRARQKVGGGERAREIGRAFCENRVPPSPLSAPGIPRRHHFLLSGYFILVRGGILFLVLQISICCTGNSRRKKRKKSSRIGKRKEVVKKSKIKKSKNFFFTPQRQQPSSSSSSSLRTACRDGARRRLRGAR